MRAKREEGTFSSLLRSGSTPRESCLDDPQNSTTCVQHTKEERESKTIYPRLPKHRVRKNRENAKLMHQVVLLLLKTHETHVHSREEMMETRNERVYPTHYSKTHTHTHRVQSEACGGGEKERKEDIFFYDVIPAPSFLTHRRLLRRRPAVSHTDTRIRISLLPSLSLSLSPHFHSSTGEQMTQDT